jgi:hypothetical protein
MLLCVKIGSFHFLTQLSVVILLDFSVERDRERFYFVLKLRLTRFISCNLWLLNMHGETILDLVELREYAPSNKLNMYQFLF